MTRESLLFDHLLYILSPNISSLLDHSLCEGIFILQLSCFYPCPSGHDNGKLCKDLMFGNCIGMVFAEFMVYFGEDFRLCCGRFCHGDLRLYGEFLKWSANKSKTLSLSDQSLQGKVLHVFPWRVRVEGQSGWLGRECALFSKYSVHCLANIAVSSLKAEVCVKKIPAIITTKKQDDINK